MLRSMFLSLSRASRVQRTIMRWPLAWRAASRFVAGTQLTEALRVIQDLNTRGINATLDHLGENTTTTDEAAQAAAEIEHILEEIDRSGARTNVSIKLTQIGLALDEAMCREHVARILAHARDCHNFVRIDMEETAYTEQTLSLYHQMRQRGFDNTGVVIQSYLYRSGFDVSKLVQEHARVRLVKGAYSEPRDVAYPRKADVDANYDRLTELLLSGVLAAGAPPLGEDGRTPPIPAIATHDARRVEFAQAHARRIGLPERAMEFQMLYGIRRDLQERLVAAGYPVRVYVPYGTHWYPYLMRRLAERPANMWFFVMNYFRR